MKSFDVKPHIFMVCGIPKTIAVGNSIGEMAGRILKVIRHSFSRNNGSENHGDY